MRDLADERRARCSGVALRCTIADFKRPHVGTVLGKVIATLDVARPIFSRTGFENDLSQRLVTTMR